MKQSPLDLTDEIHVMQNVKATEVVPADIAGFPEDVERDIYGIEADFTSHTYTRLSGAVGKSAGTDFDSIPCFGGRRRCILTDAGVVLAYYGEPGYTELGTLATNLRVGKKDYPRGTNVQVMVEQPLFYYKTIPLLLEKAADDGEKGYRMRRARYYVSMTPKPGFRVHPAFIHDNAVCDAVYLAAFEGSVYDVSASAYDNNDVGSFDCSYSTGDRLSSIGGVKPASGAFGALTRANARALAFNRGKGWVLSTIQTVALTELLFAVEYAGMDMQAALGHGVTTKIDDKTTNMAEPTGSTSALGNASGSLANANCLNVVSYRGEENFFGNIWTWVDGINIKNGPEASEAFVADHSFADDSESKPYQNVGVSIARTKGYVSAFAYSQNYDWLFLAAETTRDSACSIGDYFYPDMTDNGWRLCMLGSSWYNGMQAGGFYLAVDATAPGHYRHIGARLAFIPSSTPQSRIAPCVDL